MNNLFFRIYQGALYVASAFLPWRQPYKILGKDAMRRLPKHLLENGVNKVLVVSDQVLTKLNLLDSMFEELTSAGVSYALYDKTVQNPTIDNIEEALTLYRSAKCNGIIGFGGGSCIDCAKAVGARVAKPRKSISQMKGILKVCKKLPLLVAIPTTAGTGSETTLAAVITDSKTHHKYPINDPSLIPFCAVLDPNLTVKLPPHITATTGMDALCHAVEAYIGNANTKGTKKAAISAVELIYSNLLTAYAEPTNMQARENMQHASYLAGLAFTRAYVGNIHAMAHPLGGVYGIPHGLANAIIMPYVLKEYGKSAERKLAQLGDVAGVTQPNQAIEDKANAFISSIEKLNEKMNIGNKFDVIKQEDISTLSAFAYAEANPLYPVPKMFSKQEFADIYRKLMP